MSLQEAQKVKRKYHRLLNRETVKARSGDNAAAKQIIAYLAEYHGKLKELGYRTTDENPGDIVPITQEWIDEQLSKMTELDHLRVKIRRMEEGKEKDELIKQFITLQLAEFEKEDK